MKLIGILVVVSVGVLLGIVLISSMKQTKTVQVTGQLASISSSKHMVQNAHSSLFNVHAPAPELTGITQWLNPEKPLRLQSLHGKVVLVDFWTNQCINCIHTLPYVTKWYDTYKDQGFIVIGVHTPELAYEQTIASIQSAIATYNIHYSVAQDNNYSTWQAYNNQYWPAEYLIDKKGYIRRSFFGEGEYDQTELAIQTLLKE